MTDMELKKVKEQYLKLAQRYHPDSGAEADEAAFIKVKESFDRIVQLDRDSNGQLFLSMEKITLVQRSETEKAKHMGSLKQKIKMQKQKEIDLKQRQEAAIDRQRQEELTRQAQVKKAALEAQLEEIARQAEQQKKVFEEQKKQQALAMGLDKLPSKPTRNVGDIPFYDREEKVRKFDQS